MSGDLLELPPAESGDLCELPAAAVRRILSLLPTADRRRLGATCCHLQRMCAEAVKTLVVCQDTGEVEAALVAFPAADRLQLAHTDLSLLNSCTRLKSLEVIEPSHLNSHALLQLVSCCNNLSELCIKGMGLAGANSLDAACYNQAQLAPALQRLILQHSSINYQRGLLSLLSVAPCDPAGASSGPEAAGEVAATSSRSLQQLPSWCRALLGTCMNSPCQAAAATPRWPHLTELDLTACLSCGSSLAFLGLCPALQTLTLHSCLKVTDDTLQELHTALSTYSEACGGSTCPTAAAEDAVTTGMGAAPSNVGDAAIPLQHLDLSYTRVKDAGMPHLVAVMPQLSLLSLKGCNVGDDGLLHLLKLQHLTALHIKHCHRVTDEGITSLSSLSRLRSLSYGYTSMPEADDVAGAIATQFTALTALDLLASELTTSGLMSLGTLSQLQQLKLYQAGVTASSLDALAGQPAGRGLTGLVLYGLGMLRHLDCLDAFPALQDLQLGRLCDLIIPMDQALQQLSVLQQLTGLTLERMDDCSCSSLQCILKGCRQLQRLRVRGCDGVSQEDMEGLAVDAAAVCGSSASVWWAASPSVDTDDEEDGWQVMQPV